MWTLYPDEIQAILIQTQSTTRLYLGWVITELIHLKYYRQEDNLSFLNILCALSWDPGICLPGETPWKLEGQTTYFSLETCSPKLLSYICVILLNKFFGTLSDDTIHIFKFVKMVCYKTYSLWKCFHVSFFSFQRKQFMFEKPLIYFSFSHWSLGRTWDSNLDACGLLFVIVGHFIFLDCISKFLKKMLS